MIDNNTCCNDSTSNVLCDIQCRSIPTLPGIVGGITDADTFPLYHEGRTYKITMLTLGQYFGLEGGHEPSPSPTPSGNYVVNGDPGNDNVDIIVNGYGTFYARNAYGSIFMDSSVNGVAISALSTHKIILDSANIEIDDIPAKTSGKQLLLGRDEDGYMAYRSDVFVNGANSTLSVKGATFGANSLMFVGPHTPGIQTNSDNMSVSAYGTLSLAGGGTTLTVSDTNGVATNASKISIVNVPLGPSAYTIGVDSNGALVKMNNAGGGDMLKSTYDTDNNGRVDYADFADDISAEVKQEMIDEIISQVESEIGAEISMQAAYDGGSTINANGTANGIKVLGGTSYPRYENRLLSSRLETGWYLNSDAAPNKVTVDASDSFPTVSLKCGNITSKISQNETQFFVDSDNIQLENFNILPQSFKFTISGTQTVECDNEGFYVRYLNGSTIGFARLYQGIDYGAIQFGNQTNSATVYSSGANLNLDTSSSSGKIVLNRSVLFNTVGSVAAAHALGITSTGEITKFAVPSGTSTQSDWNVTDTSSAAFIKNKPSLAYVPTSGGTISGNLTVSNVTTTNNLIVNGYIDGDLRIRGASYSTFRKLYFGDGEHVYIGENLDDQMIIYSSEPMVFSIQGTTGSNGYVLTSDGSTCSWQPPASGGNYLPLTGGTISGDLTVQGNTTIGNAATDHLNVNSSSYFNYDVNVKLGKYIGYVNSSSIWNQYITCTSTDQNILRFVCSNISGNWYFSQSNLIRFNLGYSTAGAGFGEYIGSNDFEIYVPSSSTSYTAIGASSNGFCIKDNGEGKGSENQVLTVSANQTVVWTTKSSVVETIEQWEDLHADPIERLKLKSFYNTVNEALAERTRKFDRLSSKYQMLESKFYGDNPDINPTKVAEGVIDFADMVHYNVKRNMTMDEAIKATIKEYSGLLHTDGNSILAKTNRKILDKAKEYIKNLPQREVDKMMMPVPEGGDIHNMILGLDPFLKHPKQV